MVATGQSWASLVPHRLQEHVLGTWTAVKKGSYPFGKPRLKHPTDFRLDLVWPVAAFHRTISHPTKSDR